MMLLLLNLLFLVLSRWDDLRVRSYAGGQIVVLLWALGWTGCKLMIRF